jgi:hypothetical protein
MESCLASNCGIAYERFLSLRCGFESTICSLDVELREELSTLARLSKLTAELALFVISVLLLG